MSYLRPKVKPAAKTKTTANSSQYIPIPGRESVMKKNVSGAYVFDIDSFTALRRFLILGTESSTMYETSSELTRDNLKSLEACLNTNPSLAIQTIIEVSEAGSGIKNDPAIFSLAVAATHSNAAVREMALNALPRVCRTGTHFLMFVSMSDGMRGWGQGFKRGVWNWYVAQSQNGKLDYQLAKYRNREGWTHRDVFRSIHFPVSKMSADMARVIAPVVGKGEAPAGSYLELLERAKGVTSATEIVRLLEQYPGATWEMLPTEALNHPEVWEFFILQGMPYTALLRNLNRITAQGLAGTFAATERKILDDLTSEAKIKKARVHPLNLLIAKMIYAGGKSVKGSSTWTPSKRIVDALEDAFFKSFDVQEPTGKRFYLGLDVSGSMGMYHIKDIPELTPRAVAGVMALAMVKAERDTVVAGFSHNLIDLDIRRTETTDSVIKRIGNIPFGATNCALPVQHALKDNLKVDSFLVITDNETNYGPKHAAEVLEKYRAKVNPTAKMIMAAVTATRNSIVDPYDPLSLGIEGFDPALPKIVQEFTNL